MIDKDLDALWRQHSVPPASSDLAARIAQAAQDDIIYLVWWPKAWALMVLVMILGGATGYYDPLEVVELQEQQDIALYIDDEDDVFL